MNHHGGDAMADPTPSDAVPEPHAVPEPLRVWFRLVRLHDRMHSAMSARLKRIGLSIPQFDLMSNLAGNEGMTQQELADRLFVTKGNVSGLVDRLVQAGLVERRPMAGDRRSHALHLTADGRELARQGLAVQDAFVAESLGRLDAFTLQQLHRALGLIRDEMRQRAAENSAGAVA
jgi:DNA-binding MarR family transcriptional regulator